MISAPPTLGTTEPPSAPPPSPPEPHDGGPSDLVSAVAPLLAALPLVVLLVALVAQHPAIIAGGDRAVINLEVRDMLAGRQSLGVYSRFGWHHPGPAFLAALAAIDFLFGHVAWTLDAGMLVAGAVTAELIVIATRRAAGVPAALVAAGSLGLYAHAVGPEVFRTPWNPYVVLLPLVLFTVLCGWAAAGSSAALASAVLAATVIIQSHVAVAPVSLAVLACTVVFAWRWHRRVATPPTAAWWRKRSVWLPVAAAAALWVPPLVQEARASDPNLTDLARFFFTSHPGHSLSTAIAAVGGRLALIPFGSHHRFVTPARTGVTWHDARGGVAIIAGYLAAAALITVAGHRRGVPFARALGVFTLVALPIAVLAVHTAEGPLDGYVLAWITALPLACWIGAAALLPPGSAPAGRHRRVARLTISTAGLVAVLIGIAGTASATWASARAPAARVEDSPAVRRAWSETAVAIAGRRPSAVLLQATDPSAWPVEAGLAVVLEAHGWRAHVDDQWVFMFGASRRQTGTEPVVVTLVGSLPEGPVRVAVSAPLSSSELEQTAAQVGAALARGTGGR